MGCRKRSYYQADQLPELKAIRPKNELTLKKSSENKRSNYLFGFQGQEIDNEIKGVGNSVNYKYRIHDPRLGRFLSVDPLAASYPYYSTYQFSGNRVIDMIELEGLEPTESGSYGGQGATASELDEDGNAIEDTESQRWVWNNDEWNKSDVAVTNSELTTLFPKGTSDNLKTIETTINLEGSSFGITSLDHLAHYLAQVGHETGGFSQKASVESTIYSSLARVKKVFGSKSNVYLTVWAEQQRVIAYNGIAKTFGLATSTSNKYIKDGNNFANMAYANKIGNGNEASGDGSLFRGRGFIQLTGRANYKSFTNFYNKIYGTSADFTKTPTKLATDQNIAIISSLWFFKVNSITSIDNGKTFKQITKTINAGAVGLSDRERIYNEATKLFE